ncbi:Prostaglandin F2-alpha receptor [Merluccius polli]|uniref:Thromboxane A2 receptor n=1 Tax=Merluccius polli TaxID=89951 RepID=A0AA47ND08_MERPO|nr:Prostaglandin F2-alpha receptor [Merluccius polli]
MSTNGSSESRCRAEVRATNSTCSPNDPSVAASIVSMTGGIFSNSLALFILVKSYHRIRLKSKASFVLFASGLVVTDLLGHLVNGSLVLFIYSSHKRWEAFDPDRILCSFFGASLVFFGLSPLFLGCAMAVERCVGVTRPLFHSTAVAPRHVKRLLGFTWVLAALVAGLPLILWRPYQVQHSRSWCFFREEEPRDWLDMLLPLVFSMLGLLALLLSVVCNTLTSGALLQSKLRRRHRCRGTRYHLEMIVQLLAIMLVSCVCWGPLLIYVIVLTARTEDEPASFSLLLLLVRMATWNQILDPWVYILLRKAVLRKLYLVLHDGFWSSGPRSIRRCKCNILHSSVETRHSSTQPNEPCTRMGSMHPPDDTIKTIT